MESITFVDIESGLALRTNGLQSDMESSNLIHQDAQTDAQCKALVLKILSDDMSEKDKRQKMYFRMSDIIQNMKQDPARVATFLDNVDRLIDRSCGVCLSSSAEMYICDHIKYGEKVTDKLLLRRCPNKKCKFKNCVKCTTDWQASPLYKLNYQRIEFEQCMVCKTIIDPEGLVAVQQKQDAAKRVVSAAACCYLLYVTCHYF